MSFLLQITGHILDRDKYYIFGIYNSNYERWVFWQRHVRFCEFGEQREEYCKHGQISTSENWRLLMQAWADDHLRELDITDASVGRHLPQRTGDH
jgi:hypothetical protein